MPRSARLLILTLTAALLQAGPATAAVQVITPAEELADHVAVALGFSQLAFDDATEVLIARDDDFPDALAAGGLQGAQRPLLLTPSDALHPDVGTEIERLGATRATVLGGTAAVGEDVVTDLEDAGVTVTRQAGPSRVETAVAVAEAMGSVETAVLARAFPRDEPTQAFADSLAAGGWAAADDVPVLLTQTDSLSAPTEAHLRDSEIDTVHVVGGTVAVSDAVVAQVEALGITVARVAGDTRFATATAVAERRGLSAGTADTVILVDGTSPDGWAAGFAAAAHSARTDAPIILSDGAALPPATTAWLEGGAFSQDGGDRTLVCAAPAEACTQAADLLGATVVTLAQAGGVVHHGSPLTGSAGEEVTEVTFTGPCIPDGEQTITPAADGSYALAVAPSGQAPDADTTCVLGWRASLLGGGVQQGSFEIDLDVVQVQLTNPDGRVALGQGLTGVLDDPDIELVDVNGPCAGGADRARPQQGAFALPAVNDDLALGLCQLLVEIDFPDGGRQASAVPVEVYCLGGYVAEHDQQSAYRLFDGGQDLFQLDFTTADAFELNGLLVDYQSFLAALDVGDCITPFRPNLDPPDTPHRLWDVERCLALPGYDDPQRVWSIDTDADTYVSEEGGAPQTVSYEAGDVFWVDFDDTATLEDFEAALEPGVCIDHVPGRAGAPDTHRVLVSEPIPYGSYRGF